MEETAWELSKENIQPLKKGRQPAILTKALRCSSVNVPGNDSHQSADGSTNSSAAIRTLILQQEKHDFEERLKVCMKTDDPLAAYYHYVRWMEETHPSGKEKEIRDLVNKCLKALKEEVWLEKYSNDLRWLYIWLKFAALSRTTGSLTIYEHMRTHGHCTRLAGFYLQWASELESAGHYDDAAKIFLSGIQAEAEPSHTLLSAYEEFQVRSARRLMEEQERLEEDEEATRNVLGVLRAVAPSGSAKGGQRAPYVRHSNVEPVTCGKGAQSGNGQCTEPVLIFDENQATSTQSKVSTAVRKLQVQKAPFDKASCKENVVEADVWTKANLGQQAFTNEGYNKQNKLAIYVDPTPTTPANHSKNESQGRSSVFPGSSSGTQRPVASGSVFACCFEKIHNGTNEMSFEELRAAGWRKRNYNSKSQNNASLQSISSGRPILGAVPNPPVRNDLESAAIVDRRKSWRAPNSPTGNSSFTQNIYREAMAAFSNTLHLSGIGRSMDVENGNGTGRTNGTVSNAPATSFAIYEDPAECGRGVAGDEVPLEEADKENIDPKRNSKMGPVERKRRMMAGGILGESVEFACADNQNGENMTSGVRIYEDENPPTTTNLPTISCTSFDFNETTVAGFHRFLPAAAAIRAISTPCHNASRIQPLSLSIHKPEELVESEYTEHHGAAVIVGEPIRNISETECDPKNQQEGTGQKLSTIAETSQEYRSSSSSSTSVGTTSGGNIRSKLASCSSGMPSISEGVRVALAFNTPHSDQACAGIKPMSGDEPSGRVQGTPFYEKEQCGKTGPGKPAAVRKILMSDDEGEQMDDNDQQDYQLAAFGQAINPWNPAFVSFMLSRMPRRLESYPNFHTFDENLPNVKAGKTVCLGGETYDVLSVAGEGAYAKVFKCRLEQDTENEVVLKVQKPCCPLEFYICQELNQRLKLHNAYDSVELGLTTFKDAYMFEDGSILVADYCPYGTLVDLVNVYKQISSELSPPEIIVAYLTADILRIMEAVHREMIIHGDVKPDNFLVLDAPPIESTCDVRTLRLIDWGRSIDMALVPASTTFSGQSGTSSFMCCEMQDGRPWTYQTDLYGMLGTVHVLAFGEYMTTYKVASTNTWRITRTFKRRWDNTIWRDFFDAFLNMRDCFALPSLMEWRERFDQFVNVCRTSRPNVWASEVNKMRDVLSELKAPKMKKKKLI